MYNRPPAKKPNTGTELLRALSEVSPTLAKIAQGNVAERQAQEKAKVEAFFKDPEQFAKDVADAGTHFSSPAQVLAGENLGKRLAIQYGAYLNQEYASQGTRPKMPQTLYPLRMQHVNALLPTMLTSLGS